MQLELPIIDEYGQPDSRYSPCGSAPDIPGLDASLCRCQQCKTRASKGIWWVDLAMRKALLHPKIWAQKGDGTWAIASSVKTQKQL